MNTPNKRRGLALSGLALAVLLAACADSGAADPTSTPPAGSEETTASGEGGGNYPGTDADTFTVITANENTALEAQLTALSQDQCSAENSALELKHEKVAQADVVQKMTLMASQDALPSHFIAGTDMVRPDGDLGVAGLVADYEQVLTEAGAWDNVLPAAVSTIKNVYGHMVSLPYQYNLEGIWYNKAIFEELGVEPPATWDEFVDVSQKALDAGYTPIAQGGFDGWPLTRILGMYVVRNVGPDAMVAIRDGEAKLTDEAYMEAAQAFSEYAAAGFFGEGVTSQKGDQATAAFLSGKAAMAYNGSWLLSNINDPAQNDIGAENVGLIPFPAVEGGAGSVDHWAANAGTAQAANPKLLGENTANWFACISENYGQQALQDAGIISGFKVNGEVTDVPPATQMVQETIEGIDTTVLWFEALMDSKSNSLASTNMTLLVTGQMTPDQYMEDLQASIDANR